MKPEYLKLLTPEERSACWQFGAIRKFAENGIALPKIDSFVKKSFGVDTVSSGLDTGLRMVLVTSLLTGIPAGIVAHAIGRSVSANRRSEREMKEKIKFYRGSTSQLETGLAQAL